MAPSNQSTLYERLFQLNRCMEQAAEIVEQFRQEGLIHAEYAGGRKQALEELRADLSYVVTGMLHRRELDVCVGMAGKQVERESGAEALLSG